MRVIALVALALCVAASWAEPETAEGLKKEVEKAASEAKAGAIAEAKKDGADAAKAEAAGKQAEADVRKEAAQQQAAEEKDKAPEGASGASSWPCSRLRPRFPRRTPRRGRRGPPRRGGT